MSELGTSALDRSLRLAKEIASNGTQLLSRVLWTPGLTDYTAPLALKAAKQAMSAAPELDLETGAYIGLLGSRSC